jgi:predicted phosphodiesterase
MRYAILTDIHANLEALQAVLARIATLGADMVVCLGDLVGYNADPNACVEIMRREGIACVLGNHDAAACGLAEPDNFNPAAREAILWTRNVLAPEHGIYLRELPRYLLIDNIVLCHGSINDTNRYILDDSDVRDNFSMLEKLPGKAKTCYFGHTHIPAAYSLDGPVITRVLIDEIRLSRDRKYLINPGAVGQPRDGDPRAAFLTYDAKARNVTFHRTEYDVAACQTKIIREGLPARLAQRLALGW